MSLIRVFQIALKGGGRKPPLLEGKWKILLGVNFLSGDANQRGSAFDHSNLFQSKKHHSVNIEH